MRGVRRSWRGEGWSALLTYEPHGLHFSVGGVGQAPTDEQVQAAILGHEGGRWMPSSPTEKLMEITKLRAELGDQVNPWVRQFVAPAEFARYSRMVAAQRDRTRQQREQK
jgi:hypothetical protein